MGYDLYLRPRQPELTPDREQLLAALRARGWHAETNAMPLVPSGPSIRCTPVEKGADLEVPFGAPEGDFRATLLLGAELAAKLDLQFVDAQRQAEITPASAEEAVQSWTRANKYAVDTAGRVEDVRNAIPVEPVKPYWNTRSKVVVALLALFFVLYQLLMLSVELIKAPLRPID
jgi:hypothetical protein